MDDGVERVNAMLLEEDDPFKNVEKSNDSKKINEGVSVESKVSVYPVDSDHGDTLNQDKPKKTRRKRKSRSEKISILIEKRDKIVEALDALSREIEWLEEAPEERKEYKRKLDTHCKIIAGAIVIKMYKDKNVNFDREAFFDRVLHIVDGKEKIEHLKKMLDENSD